MLDLALFGQKECVSVKEIAQRQDISGKYLEQIITQLHRAGLVKSLRGAQGGYRLAKDPGAITVGDILRVMEGDLAPVACLEGEANVCPRAPLCVTVEIWEEVQYAIEQVVDGYTLADLMLRFYEKQPVIVH